MKARLAFILLVGATLGVLGLDSVRWNVGVTRVDGTIRSHGSLYDDPSDWVIRDLQGRPLQVYVFDFTPDPNPHFYIHPCTAYSFEPDLEPGTPIKVDYLTAGEWRVDGLICFSRILILKISLALAWGLFLGLCAWRVLLWALGHKRTAAIHCSVQPCSLAQLDSPHADQQTQAPRQDSE